MQAFQALLVKVKHHVLEIQVCMRTKLLLEREDKPEKGEEGGRVDVEMGEGGGNPQASITFTVCEGKVRFRLLLSGSSVFRVSHASSHPTLYCIKTWYHLCISDPLYWSSKNVDCFI